MKNITEPKAPAKTDDMDRFLFLDDYRHPYDAFSHTQQSMYLHKKWEVVRNYDEFIRWILKNGLPSFISFDHDLAEEHYSENYQEAKEFLDCCVYKEKTGYDCAKWLVAYCTDNNLSCPDFYCHSMNPLGKENIVGLLSQFKNYR